MTNYLQKAWSDGQDNISIKEVHTALRELEQMDDEHGAIWVAVGDDEDFVLETQKGLLVVATYAGENEITSRFDDVEEVLTAYQLLLEGKYSDVMSTMRQRQV